MLSKLETESQPDHTRSKLLIQALGSGQSLPDYGPIGFPRMSLAVASPAAVVAQDSCFLLRDDVRVPKLNDCVCVHAGSICKLVQPLLNGVNLSLGSVGRASITSNDHLEALSLVLPLDQTTAENDRSDCGRKTQDRNK